MNKYSSYKPSGIECIGDIPEHWDLIKLKYEYKIQKGRLPKIIYEESNEGLVPYLSMDILRGSEVTSFVCNDDGVFVSRSQILILWDGSNSGEIIKVDKDGILSSTMGVLKKVGEKLNEDFSFYQLKSYEPEIRNNTNGMGIPHVDGNYIRDLPLFVPPIQEQYLIVKFLEEKIEIIKKLISTIERKIELLKEQRTSLINQVITKGLDPNVKMKDSWVEWIGEIPEHWNLIPLKYCCLKKRGIQTGPFGTQLNTKDYVEIGIKVLNQKTLINEDYNSGDEFITQEKKDELNGFEVRSGDIIMGTRGSFGTKNRTTFGKCSIVPNGIDECILHPCLIRIRLNENILMKEHFKYYVNESTLFLDEIFYTSNSTTIEVIYGTTLKDIEFPIPPIQEQNQIIKYLDIQTKEIDDLVFMEQKKIDLLREYSILDFRSNHSEN